MSCVDDKARVAQILAEAHREIDSSIRETYRLVCDEEADLREPIKLLHVNESTPAFGLVPVFFGPNERAGIGYSSIIVELAPEEFEDARQTRSWLGERGWRLGDRLYCRAEEGVPAC